MDESESKKENHQKERRLDPELLKKGLRCDLDQYEMLKRCSDKKDMTEWSEWRKNHLGEDIFLEGAYLNTCHLKGIYLESRGIRSLNKEEIKRTSGKTRSIVYLKEASFTFAELQEAKFMLTVLSDAEFGGAKLQGAKFTKAILHKADLENAELERSDFCYAELQGANFETAIVYGSTLIWKPKVNRYCKDKRFTNFGGVGLDSVRIDPGTKQLLEYNIRRKNWEAWYKEHPKLKWILKPFWWVSDYGISAPRIIKVFLIFALIFACVYYLWGLIAPPGILDYLFVDGNGVKVASWLVPIRAIHFSVVVMTVGFTNMHANAHSFWAHVLVGFQMILGFVLLGALVTRFAVLFTAGGPAGKFADEKEIATEGTEEHRENK